MNTLSRIASTLLVVLAASCEHTNAHATASMAVPFTAEHWNTHGDVAFRQMAGYPDGLMESKGSAVLKDVTFKDGSIDLDFKSSKGISTILFHRGDDTGGGLVLRPQPDCATSSECIQYTPFLHGAFLWDLYPQYETRAPLSETKWNHIRIETSGKRMRVYMNGLSGPVLSIDRMGGILSNGSLRLSGPASWAHLVITPSSIDSPKPAPATAPPASDGHLVRRWSVSDPVHVPTAVDKTLDAQLGRLPSAELEGLSSVNWRPLVSEEDGLVNLSREVGSASSDVVSGVWLSTIVQSDSDQVKHVRLGWVREIAVFANGKRVFSDRNLYGSTAQKAPGGRLGLENGQFDLPLHPGKNTVRIFIDDNFGAAQHFGWGFKMRLDDVDGIRFQG